MHLLIYGPGRLGGAIARAAADAGWMPTLVGRPGTTGAREPAPLAGVVVEASAGPAVAWNLAHALAAGNRRFVLAASAWDADLPRVRALLGAIGQQLGKAPRLLGKLRGTLNPLSRFDFGHLSGLKFAAQWQMRRPQAAASS
jgi:hypothetical protein